MNPLPNSFKDSTGHEWKIKLSLAKALDIDKADKKDCGVDFRLVPPSDDFFEKTIFQTRAIMFIMWQCLKEQAAEENLTMMALFERMEGEHIHNATKAVYGALLDFFPDHRIYLSELIKAREETKEKIDRMTEGELSTMIGEQTDLRIEKAKAAIRHQNIQMNQPIMNGEKSTE